MKMASIRSYLIVVILLCRRGEKETAVVSAFQPVQSRVFKKTTKMTKIITLTTLFYRNNSTDSTTLCDDCASMTTAKFEDSAVVVPEKEYNKNNDKPITRLGGLSFGRREVDRQNVHPIYKLGWIPEEVPLSIIATAVVLLSPLLFPLLPFFISSRKNRWEELREASKEQHKSVFEEATLAYRQSQRILVERLLIEEERRRLQQQHKHYPLSSLSSFSKAKEDIPALPQVIAVTMATGQEGQGVVRGLVEAPRFQNATILALVRNPNSRAAQALAKLSARIQLVKCDSTDSESLQRALQPAQAVFLATTLNQGSAGQWNMEWDGGQYQVSQGKAFVEACTGLPSLRQIVYGTAPMRKWPESFIVEPPIHYAAKWRVERLLMNANLPVTFLRKCPYHENFTKLTKGAMKKDSGVDESSAASAVASSAAAMGVEGGGAFDVSSRKIELEKGQYQIKAMTPPDFTYNMMDPRDLGKWAVLAFSNPSILIGESLSVASDALTGPEMAFTATECGAFGEGVTFAYAQQPRWVFEVLSFVEPTFVYISGLQRWNIDGGLYDLDSDGVKQVRKLVMTSTWSDHLEREGLGQFTETMEDLLPDYVKVL